MDPPSRRRAAPPAPPPRISECERRTMLVTLAVPLVSACRDQQTGAAPTEPASITAELVRHLGNSDVVVYGASPSGVAAAVEAARHGAHVVLLEPTRHVG